jgi:nitroimidazol reductase NimA-like FMN-containing flavoprotein (pyridoxamine 5'-phosphate oxidase superfamily)
MMVHMSSLSMTKDEREAFLADLHVGVFSVVGDGSTPLTAPIWYSYDPGGTVNVIIGPDSLKAKALRTAKAFSLCAQTEAAPYAYVTVEGPVVETGEVSFDERAAMAVKYLGEELARGYLAATGGEQSGSIVVRMKPERWRTTDYAKQFG